ncbi:MAG: hypothetical protein ACE149_19650 [Armatimonadota bacterium]
MDEERDRVEGTDQSKRELVTKLLAVAGAAAAAGLAGGTGTAATLMREDKHAPFQLGPTGTSVFKFLKSPTGFRITVSGRQMGEALRSANLLGPEADLDKATIAIEFTA